MKHVRTTPRTAITSNISLFPDRRFLARPQLLTRLEALSSGAICLFYMTINESLTYHL
jgi:hypothetical protein